MQFVCFYSELSLSPCYLFLRSVRLLWMLWFWFYETKLKGALIKVVSPKKWHLASCSKCYLYLACCLNLLMGNEQMPHVLSTWAKSTPPDWLFLYPLEISKCGGDLKLAQDKFPQEQAEFWISILSAWSFLSELRKSLCLFSPTVREITDPRGLIQIRDPVRGHQSSRYFRHVWTLHWSWFQSSSV